MTDINWIFEGVGPRGRKSGGDPSGHNFRGEFETFVRETIQNSNDAAIDRPAEIVFDVRDIEGDELEDFKESIIWDELSKHLHNVAELGRMKKVNRFLESLKSNESIRLLQIEDRNCEGITGEEDEDHSNFKGLMVNELFSNKEEKSGGTYGLGKSVYWKFSQISTFLVNSTLSELPSEDKKNPRFLGRTKLPTHNVDGKEYSGPGWLGEENEVEADGKTAGKRAESVWGEKAEEISTRLVCPPKWAKNRYYHNYRRI